jgi:glycosyltransferase involved in cell wall biosynthesis
MDRKPMISFGLPVYNGANFIANAVDSVRSQTVQDWELVIVDNRSTDGSVAICQELAAQDSRIRVYQNDRNVGCAPNFNRAFQLSHGHYFSWIAHDDLIGPQFAARCLAELESDTRNVLVFPRITYINAAGQPIRRQQSPDLSVRGETAASRVRTLMELEKQGTDIFWCAYGLARRATFESTQLQGPYNGSDQTFILELALRGNIKQLPLDLFFRREHEGASTFREGWTTIDRARFSSADDTRRIVFPYCRMLKEHASAIQRTDIPLSEKLHCHVSTAKRFMHQWKYFAHEFIDAPVDMLRVTRRQLLN